MEGIRIVCPYVYVVVVGNHSNNLHCVVVCFGWQWFLGGGGGIHMLM